MSTLPVLMKMSTILAISGCPCGVARDGLWWRRTFHKRQPECGGACRMHRTSSHACVSVSRRCMTKKTGSLRLVKCAWPLRRVVFLSPTKCAYDGYSPRLPHEMYMPNTTGISPAISRNVHVQYEGYGPLSPRPCYGCFCACCNLESFWDAMWGFWDALWVELCPLVCCVGICSFFVS